MYAVIPVTIDFVNLQYTGKSTLLQMWGHFILSKEEIIDWANFILENRSNNHLRKREHFDFIVGPVADHRINSIINEEFVLKPFLDKDDEGIYKLAQEKLLNSKYDFTQLCATTEYAIALINNCLVGEGTPYVI